MTASGPGVPLELDVASVGDGCLVKATGELDLSTIDRLVEAGEVCVTGAPAQLTVDLSGVRFCDSAGINGLVKLRNRCAESGWTFQLTGLSEDLRRVIADLAGLRDFLNVR